MLYQHDKHELLWQIPLEWGKIDSSYKILDFSRTARRILLRISPMKDKPYELLFWNDFSFLLISFWNIIPNKMDAFLLGHGVYVTHIIVIMCHTPHFNLIHFRFNADFPFQFCIFFCKITSCYSKISLSKMH